MATKSINSGLFQDPPYLSSDPDPTKSDPYDKQDFIPSRYLGKNMTSGGAPCPGQHPHGYLDKQYLTFASAEQNAAVYAANEKMERRRAAAEAKNPRKPVSDAVFRYTSYPAKSTGPGSYFGCFQEKPYEHDVDPAAGATKQERKRMAKREAAAAAADAEAKRVRGLPNIKTNPPKRGTYGVPGVLLSKEVYNDHWRADLEAEEKRHRKAAAATTQPKPIGPPFRAPGVCKPFLDELPATGVPGVYSSYAAPEETGRKKGSGKGSQAAPAKPLQSKPFVSGNMGAAQDGCFNPYPNTWVDPAEEAAKAKGRKSKKAAAPSLEATRPKGADEWKPSSCGSAAIMSSCLRRFY